MTVTPTMTPKTTVTGVLLACVGAAALISILQMGDLPGSGGWRSTNIAPVAQVAPAQMRGTNAMGATLVMPQADVSAARGRN